MKEQRVVVIAGGTGYVGSAIAQQLAGDGMRVALLYRGDRAKAQTIIESLHGRGHRALAYNLTDENSIEEVVSFIEKDMGPIYVCVYAVGQLPIAKPLHLLAQSQVREQFEDQLFGGITFLSQCARRMKVHREGVIIGITTAAVVTDRNTRTRGVYHPVKHALHGALGALREELLSHGVRTYAIAPGVMEGGLNAITPRAFLDMVKAHSPTKQLATAQDIANAVSHLCSDEGVSYTDLTLLIAPESGTL